MTPIMKKTTLAVLVGSALVSQTVFANAEADANIERVSIVGTKQELAKTAGSVTVIDELELERFEYDDIARILATVPGVNIRQEDGYGLRPNIGFRGVTPERSRKINIMEDGVLIGPAPYSASSAYYFPTTSRMTAVEVTKGPSTIKYGPNTVAGALNLVTRQVPDASEGGLDLAYGSDGYNKAHAHYGDTIGDFGFLIEGLHLAADGFKQLDTGGDTGFDKSDIMAKFNYRLDGDNYRQVIELKLAHSEEESDETYLGLTDEDFRANPYRRYAASELALMDWEHDQIQFTHHIEFDNFNATTRIYRNDFTRAWRKLNEFTSSQGGIVPRLQDILTNPTTEANQQYYNVLTGAADSTLREILIIGTNDRDYYSQGIQVDTAFSLSAFGLDHSFEAGVRFHEDEIQRNHIEDNFFMRSGRLESTGEATAAAATNTESSEAISVYLQDTVAFGDLAVTAGVRGEFIDSHYQNRAPGREQDYQNKSSRIWLPSLSGYYTLSDTSGIFAGIHQGFVPTSPIQTVDIEIEKSVNYELGWRLSDGSRRAEVVAFYSDYENLKESCSISSGCDTDEEFNGGEVDIYGLEASVSDNIKLPWNLSMPWSVVYSYTQSEFQQTFYSEFDQWGFVNEGNEVPYLADNMLTVTLGLQGDKWDVSALFYYSDDMAESAQTALTGDVRDSTLAGLRTDSISNIDLSASYDLDNYGKVYVRVDNLLDEADIVSRRPFGARPSKPRQFQVGYKYQF